MRLRVQSVDIPRTSQQSLKFPPLVSALFALLQLFPSSLFVQSLAGKELICTMCSLTGKGRGGGEDGGGHGGFG